MDVDIYEFKETLKEFEGNKDTFINFSEEKGIAIIEVGSKANKEIDKKLKEMGYKAGEKVLVVVQWGGGKGQINIKRWGIEFE